MPIALFLIVLGVFSRLIPHPPNFVAIGAIALFAGAKLPKRWAFLVPLTVFIVSDMIIDAFVFHGFHLGAPTRLTGYAVFTLVVALGRWRSASTPPIGLAAKSVTGSTLFFLASNFVVWLGGANEGLGHSQTLAGLAATYVDGLPFYANSLAADLIGTAVLFGLAALFESAQAPKPVADELV